MTERDQHGRFLKGSEAARKAGRIGGKRSTGSFQKGEERAREAGRKGGSSVRTAGPRTRVPTARPKKPLPFAEFVLKGFEAQQDVDEILAAYDGAEHAN
jgi:general stress protein YciG